MNAYDAVQTLRGMIGEVSPKYWTDQMLLTALNRSQARLYMKLSMTPGDWFMKTASVTFASKIGTLPNDCAKPSFLRRTSDGYSEKIPITANPRQQGDAPYPSYEGWNSTTNRAFLYGQTLELNFSYSGALTLWYDRVNQNLHMGEIDTAYDSVIILAADLPATAVSGFKLDQDFSRSGVADYYNGLEVEYVNASGHLYRQTITDYSGITGVVIFEPDVTLEADWTYGMLSCLPRETWDVWLARAAYMAMAKPAAVVDKDAVRWLKNDMDHAEDVFDNWISTRVKDTQYMMGG